MKIPGVNPARGVQSLGRQDTRGPMRVADASARAAQFEGAGLKAIGAEVKEIGAWLEQRQKQEAVEQYNNAMLLARAEANKAMGVLDQPTMPVDTPGLEGMDFPREISVTDGGGNVTTQPRKEIRTYEVGGEWLTARLNAIQNAALENITDERAKEKFRAEWALRSSDWTVKASTALRQKRKADKLGGLQFQLDEYTRLGDEESATALIHQSVASGLVDGTQGSQLLIQLGADIDQRIAFDMIADRDAESELDEVQELLEAGVIVDPVTGEVRQARYTPEMAQQLVRTARQKEREFESDRSDRHEDGRAEATQMFLKGQLRVSNLRSMLGSDKIDAGFALQMEQKLKARATAGAVTDKALLRNMAVAISQIRTAPGEETVEEISNRLRLTVQQAVLEGRLKPTEGQRLFDEIDQQRDYIFRRPEVQRVRAAIVTMTGASLDLGGNVIAKNPMQAYRVNNELEKYDAYLNREGEAADPNAYLQGITPALRDATSAEFTSAAPQDQTVAEFASTFGARYAKYLPKDVPPNATTRDQWRAAILTAMDNGEVDYQMGERDLDLLNGALPSD